MSYDDWKTTEPDYYDPSEYCEDCGKPPDRCRCDELADITESIKRSVEKINEVCKELDLRDDDLELPF